MPPLNVRPTRRDYLETLKKLHRAEEGYELLEQKRQILVMELMTRVEAARRIKDQIASTMAEAYRALGRALAQGGYTGLMRQSCGIAPQHRLTFRSRSVMGVPVPEVRCELAALEVAFSLTEGRTHADAVLCRFRQALVQVAELAEVENAVFRLAREIKRTQRRVRALEKTFIPQYKRVLKFIEEALAERQREEFIVLRKVKRRRQAAAARRMPLSPAPAPSEAS